MTHQEVGIVRIRRQQHVKRFAMGAGAELVNFFRKGGRLNRRTGRQLDHGFAMRAGAELVGQVHVGRLPRDVGLLLIRRRGGWLSRRLGGARLTLKCGVVRVWGLGGHGLKHYHVVVVVVVCTRHSEASFGAGLLCRTRPLERDQQRHVDAPVTFFERHDFYVPAEKSNGILVSICQRAAFWGVGQ
jgi:hypothetical protein